MSDKPWNGRFTQETDPSVERFTASIAFDRRLFSYDIKGSIAHCRMLARQGVISEAEASEIIGGLEKIAQDMEQGRFQLDETLEDVHMNIEARLADEVGPVAQKLHTARSRNDQVVLDVRMYLRDVVDRIMDRLTGLRRALVDCAEQHLDIILPGYTHLQRAQPVLLAHHMMAYYEMFTRDRERFKGALKRINIMPLGSAALAGTTYPIDPAYTAELLGFDAVSANSMDAVSSRDFILEFLSAAAICMVHLSRLSEELVLWSSSEFGFVTLPDAFSTGSSIMPQKKNPDVCELARAKAGRVFGDLVTLLTVVKGLPLAYNRDLQEDKEPLFDTVDTLQGCLEIYESLIPKLHFNRTAMAAAARRGYLNATEVADYLVTKGAAFRQAHHCAGQVVRYALEQGKELNELTLDEFVRFSPLFQADIFDVLTPEQMIARRTSPGGTAARNVAQAIETARRLLAQEATGTAS